MLRTIYHEYLCKLLAEVFVDAREGDETRQGSRTAGPKENNSKQNSEKNFNFCHDKPEQNVQR